jgi:hypothetical protein
MRRGDGRADHDCIASGALATGDVGGHHRLAVAREHGVGRAEHDRQGNGEEANTESQVSAADQVVEYPGDLVDQSGQRTALAEGATRVGSGC